MQTRIERCLSDFEGSWRLHRNITPVTGPTARFEGTAVWSVVQGGCDYVEKGVMTLGNQPPLHAERRYFWSDGLSVYFEDGRFFHQVPALGGVAHHWCDPDTYDVTYDFKQWPQFRVLWRVKGPRKDYTATTQYVRC